MTKTHVNVSWSRLREWMTCHWRYNLSYERYLTPKRTAPALYLGGAFHDWLDFIYSEIPRANPGFKRRATGAIKSKLKRIGLEGEDLEEMMGYALKYVAHIKRHKQQEPEVVFTSEFPFSVPMDVTALEESGDIGYSSVSFIGIIDLIVGRRGRVEIWDHKLQANHPNKNSLDHPSISYPQMGIYAWASDLLGHPIRRSVLNVFGKRRKADNVQRYPIQVSSHEAEEWGNWLHEKVGEMLSSEDRSKSLGLFACGNCSFRYPCMKHQTKGARGFGQALAQDYEKKTFSSRMPKWQKSFSPSMLSQMKEIEK